jgi:transglutaminase-like putative cysteine protease
MPLPLTSDHLGNLDVRPHAIESSSIETDVAVSRGRLEVRARASSSDEMTIGATATFTAVSRDPGREPPRSDLGAPDPRYLRQRDGLVVVSNRIAALASSLAGPGDDPLATIRAFWNYCLDEFFQGAVHYDQVDLDAPGDWLLDSGWGDCQLVAAVFASMCRARAIPARILGGFYLYKARPTEHFWAEAWIDGQGWTPLDARLTNQCFPFEFTGAIGVKIPAAWQVVQSMEPDGASVALLDVTGSLVYRDFVSVPGCTTI